jgi:hypothetical protein
MPAWVYSAWDFLRDSDNRTVIAWLGSGIVTVIVGIRAAVKFFSERKKDGDKADGTTTVMQSWQGAASGRDTNIGVQNIGPSEGYLLRVQQTHSEQMAAKDSQIVALTTQAAGLSRPQGNDGAHSPNLAVIDAPNALQIVFGTDRNFETKRGSGLYKMTHTFSVAVKNVDSARFLSNCKLFLDISNQGNDVPTPYLLVDTFTLNASEERYVPIVSYDEPATISQHAGKHIRLLIPVHAGFYDVGIGWPWQMPIGAAYIFTLRAISKETVPCEVACNVWVDDTQKLHFEKA